MGDKTKIQWTEATWNPLRGCSKVSAGCRNCYAESVANRFSGPGQPYEGTIEDGRWSGQVRLVPEVLDQPLRWQRPRLIFVNSMSDLFHEDVPFDYIDQVFAVMALASRHTFQILTKRPDRMLEYMTKSYLPHGIDKLVDIAPWMEQHGWISPEDAANIAPPGSTLPKWPEWPLPNVWLGVSVEDQATADERIPLLLQTPAAVRWLSCEPLLGSVDLSSIEYNGEAVNVLSGSYNNRFIKTFLLPSQRINWVVVGGESGPHARPMHLDWAREIRDQCIVAEVPFYFKQWGEWVQIHPLRCNEPGIKGKEWYNFDPDTAVCRIGKKAAGRLLDGREWNEMPVQAKEAVES
ncbi:DUF5131 family protein [Paenibacillus daejeonensis]|uniref:DUF5131 family protein n=1 Tax=Paenibacillus daejeonensis TaxID=135193 RepID=UPI00037AC738|nr:phage Gp37/Gp68 family protein [Paenibacillus daejeonensis]